MPRRSRVRWPRTYRFCICTRASLQPRWQSKSIARAGEAEMHQRFTEAIVDPCRIAIRDRSRTSIVAWNRNRELGELGVPRGQVLGKSIYDVLTKQKRECSKANSGRSSLRGHSTN
jgi:hypothetical protein